jgi:hypothetical protein
VESHANGKRRCCPDNPGGLPLSSDLKAYLSEVSLHGENQRGQGRKRLEGPQIRIESIPKGREWGENANYPAIIREEKFGGEVRG